jgi:hypothetical protein
MHESQLVVVRRRLEACTLRSPAKGWVLTRRPRDLEGTAVEGGRTVLEVAEAGTWLVEIRIPQDAIPLVEPGRPTTFSTPALPGEVYEGRVLAVAGAAEAGPEPVFVVTAEASDPGGTLRSGMRGRGHVRLGTRLLGVRFLVALGRWFRWKTGW